MHNWITEVLTDIETYAHKNGLVEVAAAVQDAKVVCRKAVRPEPVLRVLNPNPSPVTESDVFSHLNDLSFDNSDISLIRNELRSK